MNGEAVKEIAGLVPKPQVHDIGGRKVVLLPRMSHDQGRDGDGVKNAYVDTWDVVVPDQPEPVTALHLTTLRGLVAYVKSNNDGLNLADHCLLVDDHATVLLLRKLGPAPFHRREVVAKATLLETSAFRFGAYMDPETFIVGLLTVFADAGDRASIMKLVGNIRDQNVREFSDDGYSQAVVVSKGVSGAVVGTERVPNPVTLAPYRTFREVTQPPSPFLLRMRSGKEGDGQPGVALFEADGGAWRLEAVDRISTYLTEELEDVDIEVLA